MMTERDWIKLSPLHTYDIYLDLYQKIEDMKEVIDELQIEIGCGK